MNIPPDVAFEARDLAVRMQQERVPYNLWTKAWPGGKAPEDDVRYMSLSPLQKELIRLAEDVAIDYRRIVGSSLASFKSWRELWPDTKGGEYIEYFEEYFEPENIRGRNLPYMTEGTR